jgi:deferrochelatase/peroxidase EfeB
MNLGLTHGVDLDKPLEWKKANSEELKLLQNLQGNILKGHGRHYTANIFFRFGNNILKSKRVLRELANFYLTSAYRQLLDTEVYKATKKGGGAFAHLALSFKGYQALGMADKAPGDNDFQKGLQHPDSIADLNDPTLDQWEEKFREESHGLLLAADETESSTAALTGTLIELLEDAGADVILVQRGAALFNAVGDGIEHFGYVDGRSQPLLLVEDIEKEAKTAGTSSWDPAFPLSVALVKDPGTPDIHSYGSYFIFRKLEQFVRAFKDREQQIANDLNLVVLKM